MIKLVFLHTFLFVLNTTCFAQQTGSLAGQVKDGKGVPIIGATVTVKLPDNRIAKISASGDAGRYEVTALKPGKYYLVFTAIGFDSLRSEAIAIEAATETTYNASLQATNNQLQALEVTARKQFVEAKPDRLILNPDALISTSGSNTFDVLDKAPGVMIDDNGQLSLKGKSVVVFLDDKPSYMSGSQLIEFLKSQSATTIDKIEIMSNPPAKYDAAGGGVINIKTKKSKVKGFNGTATASYLQGVYARTNNVVSLNYRNNSLNLFGNFSQVLNNNFNDLFIDRDYFKPSGAADYTFEQRSFIRTTSNSLNGRLGADFYLNNKTTLGAIISANSRNFYGRTTNTSYIVDEGATIDSIITADNKDKGRFTNTNANLNLRHDFRTKGANLAVDLDYLVYEYDNNQQFENKSFFNNGSSKYQNFLKGQLPANIKIASFKADLNQPLHAGVIMDAGIKSSYTKTNNLASYFIGTAPFGLEPDYDRSNHFLYEESIYAGYINLSREYKRFTLQAGLRVEHTKSKGHQLGNLMKADSSFDRKYTNMFPTVYLSYKLDTVNKHTLVLSYGKRIDRPPYQDLNPFISPLDQFTNYVGNPLLQPSFTQTIELQHIYKGRITTSLSHHRIKDIVQEAIEVYGNNYYSKPANVGTADISVLSINGNQPITRYWTLNVYTDFQRRQYTGQLYSGKLDTTAFSATVNITNQFQLAGGWGIEVSGNWRSNILVGQIVSGRFWALNAGVQKKVLNNKGTIRLNLRDIFYTRLNWGYINNLKDAKGYYHNQYETRIASISFSYQFGKTFQSRKTRAAGGAQEEQNRVRS